MWLRAPYVVLHRHLDEKCCTRASLRSWHLPTCGDLAPLAFIASAASCSRSAASSFSSSCVIDRLNFRAVLTVRFFRIHLGAAPTWLL